MGQSHRFINEAALKELHLNGRLFTWSNERLHPTLERIDRAFVTTEWDLLYPNCDLQSLARIASRGIAKFPMKRFPMIRPSIT